MANEMNRLLLNMAREKVRGKGLRNLSQTSKPTGIALQFITRATTSMYL